MRKNSLLRFGLALCLTAVALLSTTSAQVGSESCVCYGDMKCCQIFVYTAAGWIPVTEPEWNLSSECYNNPPVIA